MKSKLNSVENGKVLQSKNIKKNTFRKDYVNKNIYIEIKVFPLILLNSNNQCGVCLNLKILGF